MLFWRIRRDLNPRLTVCDTVALPTELQMLVSMIRLGALGGFPGVEPDLLVRTVECPHVEGEWSVLKER